LPKVRLKGQAERQLKTLPYNLRDDVDAALVALYANAEAGIPLRGNLRGKRKLVVGPVRVLYRIRENGRLVIVDAVLFRGTAYPKGRH
jgi:mRNA-degrading endonuclease RelE of RelBE toxin-antitoxin system